jgi:hypothetical protein
MGREAGLRHARKHLAAAIEDVALLGAPDALSLKAAILTSDDPILVEQLLIRAFSVPGVALAA